MQFQGTCASKFGLEISDAALVKAALAGERDAYAELYRRYLPRVTGYLRLRIPPNVSLEDMVQEAFTQALERLGEFREDAERYSCFGQWLCGIAGRVLAQDRDAYWRARRAHEASVDALWRDLRENPVRPDPSEELSAELAAKVATLSPERRRVIELHYLEGQSAEQVAAIMDQPYGWVRRNVVAALRQLRPAEVASLRRRREGAVTRARLIEAARQVIAEHDLQRATRRAIAERAEVTVNAINHHFGSLAGLLTQAMGVAVKCRTGVRPAVAA